VIPLTEIAYGKANISHRIGSQGGRGIVVINVSQKCPLKCVYCYSSSSREGTELEEDMIDKVVHEIASISPRLVIVSGGEPLLYRNIDYLLYKLSINNIRTVISSNGLFIDENTVKMLREYNIDYVGISLDIPSGADSKIRVGSSFEKIREALIQLRKSDVDVGIRMTLTWANLYVLEDMLRFCHRYDIHRLCIYHLAPSGRGSEVYRLLKPSTEIEALALAYLIKILRTYRDIDVLTVTEPSDYISAALLSSFCKRELEEKIERFSRRSKCNAGRSIVSIYPDLSVYPCQFDNRNKIGSLRTEPLRKIMERRLEQDCCRGCRLWELCRGCRLRLGEDNIDEDCTLRALYKLARVGRLRIEDWKVRFLEDVLAMD